MAHKYVPYCLHVLSESLGEAKQMVHVLSKLDICVTPFDSDNPKPILDLLAGVCETVKARLIDKQSLYSYIKHYDKQLTRLLVDARKLLDLLSASPLTTLRNASMISEKPNLTCEKAKGGSHGKRMKGVPLAEAEIRVREWLEKNAKIDFASITRNAIAKATGVSFGQVSKTKAWKAFRDSRDEKKKSDLREVQLTSVMMGFLSSDCEEPCDLAALIEEQELDMQTYPRYSRRHSSRHEFP